MGNLYIWPLISQSDIVTINRLTLILEFIGRCDIKHILMLQIKTIINSVHNITNITAHCIRLTAILVTMFVSTFITKHCYSLYLTLMSLAMLILQALHVRKILLTLILVKTMFMIFSIPSFNRVATKFCSTYGLVRGSGSCMNRLHIKNCFHSNIFIPRVDRFKLFIHKLHVQSNLL